MRNRQKRNHVSNIAVERIWRELDVISSILVVYRNEEQL